MLMTFARFWSWTTDYSSGPSRDAGLHFHARAYAYRWSAQVPQIAGDVQKALLRGFEQLMGNPPAYRFF